MIYKLMKLSRLGAARQISIQISLSAGAVAAEPSPQRSIDSSHKEQEVGRAHVRKAELWGDQCVRPSN